MFIEQEKEILGQLILAPHLLELDLLDQGFFSSEDARKTFAAITEIWEEMRPTDIDIGILAAKKGLSMGFISGLISGNYRPTQEAFTWRIRELKRKRASERVLKLALDESQQLVKTGEVDPASLDKIREGFAEIEGLDAKAFDPAAVLMPGKMIQALQLETEWTVEKLIPARSISVLHSPGGLGKTWFSLALAKAVSSGTPFLGLKTTPGPVCYIDFENPLPVLVGRVRRLDIRDVLFWHLSANPSPPRLDTSEYKLYRQLPAGALIIFDALRATHSGDENSSQDMAFVMGRLKELRELNHPILLIHHTPKASERLYKGSTAISDLADHVLKLYQSRRGGLEEIQEYEEPGIDARFVLTTGKTRFEHFHLFLSFDIETGEFVLAEDPNAAAVEAVTEYIKSEADAGRSLKQTDIVSWAKKEGIGPPRRAAFLALLNRGERELKWVSSKGFKGGRYYYPPTSS